MEVNATDGVGFSIVFVLFLFFVFVLVTPLTASAASQPLGKSAAITGKLEVRLMGCQDLLEDVPGRSRRDSTHSAPNDLKSFVKGALKVIRKHSASWRSEWIRNGSSQTWTLVQNELLVDPGRFPMDWLRIVNNRLFG